eukprot:5436567-Amphidinium_carterae.2
MNLAGEHPKFLCGSVYQYQPTHTLQAWLESTYRVGEAYVPGPSLLTVKRREWSRVTGSLLLGHDIVALQKTFRFVTESRSTKPVNCAATGLSCQLGAPLDAQVEDLPVCANTLNLCNAWSVECTGMVENGRAICCRVRKAFTAVAALGNRMIFILGDWSFEPDEIPIDLIHGRQ